MNVGATIKANAQAAEAMHPGARSHRTLSILNRDLHQVLACHRHVSIREIEPVKRSYVELMPPKHVVVAIP